MLPFWSVFAKMNGYAPFSKPFFTSKVGGLNRQDWVGMLRFRQGKRTTSLSYIRK